MRDIKKLYFFRTSDKTMFIDEDKNNNHIQNFCGHGKQSKTKQEIKIRNEIEKHRQFRVGMVDYLKLLFNCKSKFSDVF